MNRTDRHDATQTDRLQTERTDRPQTGRSRTERTVRNVSHTHPHADRGALDNLFERGPVVAADGGEREAYDASEEDGDDETEDARRTAETPRKSAEDARMRDVDHTPPHDEGDGVNRVFERGGKEEPVESEE